MIKKEYADFYDWSFTSLDLPEENELVKIGYIEWKKEESHHKQIIKEDTAYYKKVGSCDSCLEWYTEDGVRILKNSPSLWMPLDKNKDK